MGEIPPQVRYVLPAKPGGVTNVIANLLRHRRPDGFRYAALLTNDLQEKEPPFALQLAVDEQATVDYRLSAENLHGILRRLRRRLPPAPGVLVANDLVELLFCHVYDPGGAVLQILHGDFSYYYDMAVQNEPVVDGYIAISRAIEARLHELLPKRKEDVYYLPFGVPIPERVRTPAPGPLRLLYAGRLWNDQKRVFDLPAIDANLAKLGADVRWTIAGEGPDGAELRRRWRAPPHVHFLGARPNAELIALMAEHDAFVLPTRAEGFPVALMEAMGVGLVPVVSDIASGVPEVVSAETGYRRPIGDVESFARAIGELASDRERLETMSGAARRTIVERFDVRERVADYQALYARWRDLRKQRSRPLPIPFGNRLDQPWLPNAVVYSVRKALKFVRGNGPR